MSKIELKKKIQRSFASKKRLIIKANNLNAHHKLHQQLIKLQSLKNVQTIASFISIKTEISLSILNRFLERL